MERLIVIIFLVIGIRTAQAAPFTLDDKLEVFELKFSDITDHPGMLWAGANGTLGDTPQHVTVNSMKMQADKAVSAGGSGDFGFQSIVIVLLIVLILIVLAGVILVVKKKSTLQSVIFLAYVSGFLLMQIAPAYAESTPWWQWYSKHVA